MARPPAPGLILRAGFNPLIATAVVCGVCSVAYVMTSGSRNSSSHSSNKPDKVFSGGPAFVSLTLEQSDMLNHNTKRLRFRLPNEDSISGHSLTSAVLTMSWPKGQWLPVARPYTPISLPDEPGVLELLVKKYPNGKQSSNLHSLSPGDTLFFAAALRGPQWQPNSFGNIVLLAGGAGITPIYQLARGILRNPDDKTCIELVVGVNTDEDVLLKGEIETLQREFPGRLNTTYLVSGPSEGSPFKKGRMTEDVLREICPRNEQETKVFVCGPPQMEAALVGKKGSPGVLERLGYEKRRIVTF